MAQPRRIRGAVHAAAWLLLVALPWPGGSQTANGQDAPDPVERLARLTQVYAGLTSDTGPDDPAALAGEFILLQEELSSIERTGLIESARIDHDILRWRLELGIAAQLEPELGEYGLALLLHTGERQDARTLHDLGLREVARLRQAMQNLMLEYEAEIDLKTFLDAARDDPRLYAGSREELLGQARTTARRLRAQVSTLFHDLPLADFQLVTPGDREGPGYMAYYQGPGRGRSARGYIVLNADPRQVPLFTLDALLLHEAIPGHHLQMAWTNEQVETPGWRRGLMLTVFVEGWGLYAESLGTDLGVYQHPMSEFGRLNLEMWRAIRLVVDTGLHAFDWSTRQALDYFADNTALPRAQIAVEVQRYARNPGQAVAYKLGEQRLLAMRARAEEALGAAFDVRDFHRVVLRHGPVPMHTLDEIVDDWIAAELTAPDA
jgi:uncharacterized protein (DUF885 family)